VVYELTLNRKNVPTLATSYVGRGKIAEILKQEAAKRGGKPYTIIDLGSGRGELTRRIACAIPEAQVIGIEMARIPYLQSAFVQRWLGPKNLSYQCLDFWPYDCADVDAVVFYLSGTFARRVGEKLYKEMKPGSVVISHTFPLIGEWTLVEEVHFRSPFKEQIFVYRKTAA
jgi:SAM-dependent methyltransferase